MRLNWNHEGTLLAGGCASGSVLISRLLPLGFQDDDMHTTLADFKAKTKLSNDNISTAATDGNDEGIYIHAHKRTTSSSSGSEDFEPP